LEIAFVYANRTDWLLSNDDSEESFEKRLQQDLIAVDEDLKD
jgi:hypothetical protein